MTSGTSYKWEGLTNGTSYQVRVQAVNRAPDPSDWSSFSVGEVPAGKPAAPGTPTTTAATPVGSQAQIKVTWPGVTGDAANGDVVSDYTLVVYQGGSEVGRFTQSGTSRAVNLDPSQTDFTFKVSARNKAGSSELSAAFGPTSRRDRAWRATRRGDHTAGRPSEDHLHRRSAEWKQGERADVPLQGDAVGKHRNCDQRWHDRWAQQWHQLQGRVVGNVVGGWRSDG